MGRVLSVRVPLCRCGSTARHGPGLAAALCRGRGQRIHRRFGLLQAVFYERTGNHGDGLLDTEMAAVLGVPPEDAVRLTAAAMGINCKREEAPEHLRGQIKAALGL